MSGDVVNKKRSVKAASADVDNYTEWDFFKAFPPCSGTRPFYQLENDSYAHATSYMYSLRHCMLQYTQKHKQQAQQQSKQPQQPQQQSKQPQQPQQQSKQPQQPQPQQPQSQSQPTSLTYSTFFSPLAFTPDDSRSALFPNGKTPCGDLKKGSVACVLTYFDRKHKNPLTLIHEDEVEFDLKTQGPIVARISVRKDFLEHIERNDPSVYHKNHSLPILGQHVTTVIGFGTTPIGEKYVKCIDSNANAKTGGFYTYRLPLSLPQMFFANRIDHPVMAHRGGKLYQPGKEKEKRPVTEQGWNGAGVDEWTILGKDRELWKWLRTYNRVDPFYRRNRKITPTID